ncbi:adenosylcobinamide-GDP ribazoletransferase [Prochlorococcus sp. AH-716-I09]|nr:adenosylcobinamide-GDP ribazoletransferase [Prochlorococcus sp. AH-716-I09]
MAGSWIFYTTFPKIPLINPEFKNIAQFAPLLGFFIGTIQSYFFIFLRVNSWSIYTSALVCLALGYLITGGLHIDGLMDTFDGIFAGEKKCLKAMKDSKVGSFGVQSLVFVTLIQIASILKIQSQIISILPICLFWGRFSNLFFIENFKYRSYKKKSISHKKYWNGFKKESLISIIFLFIFISYQLVSITSQAILIKFLFLILIGIFLSCIIPNMLGNKIGGFNGDACGASVVLVETAMLFMHAILL